MRSPTADRPALLRETDAVRSAAEEFGLPAQKLAWAVLIRDRAVGSVASASEIRGLAAVLAAEREEITQWGREINQRAERTGSSDIALSSQGAVAALCERLGIEAREVHPRADSP